MNNDSNREKEAQRRFENTTVAKRIRGWPVKREAAKEHASQNLFAVFTEWTGEADEKAYADL